jgi:hypothetical protein
MLIFETLKLTINTPMRYSAFRFFLFTFSFSLFTLNPVSL